MRILLGVGGGIAAYKSAELIRLLQQRGHRVQVALTRAGARFATPLTLATLSGEPLLRQLFRRDAQPGAPESPIDHIAVAQAAEVVVIAPATANLLARLAHGLADDILTTVVLASPAPLVLAPSMNVQMWRHPATQANLELLRRRGAHVVEPEAGYLACGMVGEGRLAGLEAIAAAAEAAYAAGQGSRDLAGESVLITAGPTREAWDAIRYLSNRSSGKMGYALAAAALGRGARVHLISGPTALTPPDGAAFTAVTTAEEMAAAALGGFDACTIAICAAAVADYRPVRAHPGKLKKTAAATTLELEPTPDILAELGRRKRDQLLIGFAAETDPVHGAAHARAKLAAKNADLVVLNQVNEPGIGFDADENAVTLVGAEGDTRLERAAKPAIAHRILDAVLRLPRHAAARS